MNDQKTYVLDDPDRTNIPQSRFLYRKTTLNEEYEYIESIIDETNQ